MEQRGTPKTPPVGQDTATGTDPNAKYHEPGYEEVSFGQAVNRDQTLVDELLEETNGDEVEAAERFEHRSAGSEAHNRDRS